MIALICFVVFFVNASAQKAKPDAKPTAKPAPAVADADKATAAVDLSTEVVTLKAIIAERNETILRQSRIIDEVRTQLEMAQASSRKLGENMYALRKAGEQQRAQPKPIDAPAGSKTPAPSADTPADKPAEKPPADAPLEKPKP